MKRFCLALFIVLVLATSVGAQSTPPPFISPPPPPMPSSCATNGHVPIWNTTTKRFECGANGAGSMVYPGAGIPVSTGSAWGTSISPGTGVAAALAAALNGSGGLLGTGNAAVLQSPLTGFSASPGTVAATDNILQALQKIVGNTPTVSSLHVDDILTALGIAGEATHFGTFTGGLLNDNQTAKQLFQAIEQAIEGIETGSLTDLDDLPGDTIDDNKVDNQLIAAPVITSVETADTGADSTPATQTVTPTAAESFMEIITRTCNDNDGCTDTLSETGATSGKILIIQNIGAYSVTYTNQSNVLRLNMGSGDAVLSTGQAMFLIYRASQWEEIGRTFSSMLLSDSTAQFYNVADPTKKVKIDPSNQGTGQTGTIQAPPNGTATLSAGTSTITVASGAKALATSAISSGACTSAQTDTATGTATTDVIHWSFSADPTSTTGYSATSNGMLTIISYPTSNTVNFKVCNNTGASITPGAVTLNWRVVR